MKSLDTKGIAFACTVLVVLLVQQISAEQSRDADEQQLGLDSARANRLLANGLTRFLMFNQRQVAENPANKLANNQLVGGYKRSGNRLEPIAGITLGKRSAPVELVNLEPFFGRQYSIQHSAPRMYDMRWAPLDSVDASSSTQADYN